MNLKINKKDLEFALSKISKALTQNPALISLKGIVFDVQPEEITLTTSDGLLTIKHKIKVTDNIEILKPGTILIPGKTFIETIKKQDNEIELNSKDSILKIKSKNTSINMNLLDPEEYPILDFEIIGDELILDADNFRKAIKDVSFAASENDKRIILSGINLVAKNKKLRISATDSYRLATTKIGITSDNDFNITILARNLKDFIPSTIKGEIKLQIDENKINLKHDNTLIQSRLIDGIYPELSNLIPKEYNFSLKIKEKVLSNLIDKAVVIHSSDTKTVKLSIKNKELFIESKNEELGNSKVSTKEFQWDDDEEFFITFDSKFIKDALRQFKDEVNIRFISELKPFIVTSESNNTLVQLILPHRGY